nr:MAG TPA: hypothetical protein [Caudoviricetes sp.]
MTAGPTPNSLSVRSWVAVWFWKRPESVTMKSRKISRAGSSISGII